MNVISACILFLAFVSRPLAVEGQVPQRLALVDQHGAVVNVIVAGAGWQPPEGLQAISAAEGAEPGGTWDGSQFHPAVASAEGPATAEELAEQAALRRRRVLLAHIEDVWIVLDGSSQGEREAAKGRVRAALAEANAAQAEDGVQVTE